MPVSVMLGDQGRFQEMPNLLFAWTLFMLVWGFLFGIVLYSAF